MTDGDYVLAGKRDPLSVACAAVIFGSVVAPFYLIAFGVLRGFPAKFTAIALPALAICTAILFGVFLRQSRFELALRSRLGKSFAPLLYLAIALCLLVTYALLGRISHFALFSRIEHRFVLAALLWVSSAVALIAVALLPPSRLETALSVKLGRSNRARRWYRVCAYALLTFAVVLSGWIAYAYYVTPSSFLG